MVESPSPEEVVRDFMVTCMAAWRTGDATALGRYFSDDAEYHNGPFEPVNGRADIVTALGVMMGMAEEVDTEIRTLVADDHVVMTERIDYVRSGEKVAGLRIAGVFEIHNGLITAWRDYFDPNELASERPSD